MSRALSEIEIDTADSPGGLNRVSLTWLDEAGERRVAVCYGLSAHRVKGDLERHAAQGEQSRSNYLFGLTRGISLERMLDNRSR